jgi:hypothetical protein
VIWSGKQPHITSFHVVLGAATLALSLTIALSTRTLAWKRAAAEPKPAFIEVPA